VLWSTLVYLHPNRIGDVMVGVLASSA
jgi:hypothetical protein